jgi:subtilisin-like proprotein convertase family protein
MERFARRVTVASVALLTASAGLAVNTPEVEPNDTKATAQLVVMACGDTITGNTTGSSTTVPGAASADYYRIRTVAAGGITEYTLAMTSGAAAPTQTITIQGLNQASYIIGTTDTSVQFGTATGAPANSQIIRWYGHGPAGSNQDIYVKVTGTTATTNNYVLTLSCAAVAPIAIAGSVPPGSVKVAPDTATDTAMDTDFWVYDSTVTPIPTFGHDDVDINGVTRTLNPGTYYVAMGNFNTCNNQNSPSTDDTYGSGNVLDFPNVTVNTTTGAITAMNCVVSNGATSITGTSSRLATDSFRMPWYQFTVPVPQGPTATLAVNPISGQVGQTFLATSQVVPGAGPPPSTGITVSLDASGVNAGTVVMHDDGLNGDVTAGDNTFSAQVTVGAGATAGGHTLTATIQDAQGRSTQAGATFNVVAPPAGTDLGAHNCESDYQVPVVLSSGTGVSWFKITLPAVTAAAGFVDIWTSTGGGSPMTDTMLGYYDNNGNLITYDDDDSDGLYSALSFGRTSPTRAAVGNGAVFDGRDGPRAAGSYWVSVSNFSTTFNATGWSVVGTGGYTTTTTVLHFHIDDGTGACPTPPGGIGANGTASVNNCGAGTSLLTVATSPGSNPPSSGIGVFADLSSIGGSATQTFFDDGTNGDVTANDGIFSYNATVATTATAGAKTFAFTVSDAQSRSSTGTITGLTVTNCISGVGGVSPASVTGCGDQSALLTVTVTAGAGATGITVNGNLTSIGGSATQTFYDDGTHGDVTANDNVFSYNATIAAGTTAGAKTMAFTVGDVQGHTATGNITGLTVTACPTGRCCNGSTCSITTQFGCGQSGGTYGGDGTNCSGTYTAVAGSSTTAFPVAIPDYNTVPGVADALFTANAGSGTADSSFGIAIGLHHTWVGDLIITITHGSTSVIVSNRTGSSNDLSGVYTYFDGAATTWATAATAATTPIPPGTYIPVNAVAAFAGATIDGDWNLHITDNAGGDIGTIDSFSVGTVASTACAPSTGRCCTNNTCHVTTQAACTGTWTAGAGCVAPGSPGACPAICGSSDFNCDGDTGTDADIEAFFTCLSGTCPPLPCISTADFNGDGDTGTDSDIEAFFRVLAGGSC